ncbi:hypothetical protein Tco_1449562 [Tanacetum coccineum]
MGQDSAHMVAASKVPMLKPGELQKLASQLELLDEKNHSFVVWRNKADLDTMSMDDLYNNLKVYEPEVKGILAQVMAHTTRLFVSSSNNNTSSTNEAVNTAHEVSTTSTQVNAANSTNIDNLSDAVIFALFASQPNSPQLVHEDLSESVFAFQAHDREHVISSELEEIDEGISCLLEVKPKEGKSQENIPLKLVKLERRHNLSKITFYYHYGLLIHHIPKIQQFTHDDGSKPSSDDGKKVDEDPRKDSECKDQEKEDNVNSTNNVNTAGNVNTYYSIFDFSRDDEDDGVVADMNNLDTTIQVSPNLTTRIHKDHPLDQVIGDFAISLPNKKDVKEFGGTWSDYARASLDRKSTTGGCQFLECRLILWQCKKQKMVANSTTEAKYVQLQVAVICALIRITTGLWVQFYAYQDLY